MIMSPTKEFVILIVVAGMSFSACATQDSDHKTEGAPDAAHAWTYEGETGPEHWGTLNPAWAACSEGMMQSPINLQDAVLSDLVDPELNYQLVPLNVTNNGHSVQASIAAGNTMVVDNVSYEMLQFHFHSPSEHSRDGQLSSMELHLVHRSADGVLAVIGVMIEEGDHNPAYDAIMSALPANEGDILAPEGASINPRDLLPQVLTTYRYMGSLTTPPCSEGLQWMVMTTPVQLSPEQIAGYYALYSGTNRPVQPLNERTLTLDES